MTAMGRQIIRGNDIAGISESELPVYQSPDIPEHPNMPNMDGSEWLMLTPISNKECFKNSLL